MAVHAEIFFEREEWKRPLWWSVAFHIAVVLAMLAFAMYVGRGEGANWGSGEIGSAMGATLVSRASIPLPPNPVQTKNVLANQSQGLSYSQPKAAEESPEAVPIQGHVKPKLNNRNAKLKPPPPPPEDNTVPYGEGGPVSGPYTVFSAANMEGGLSLGNEGDFGKLYGWYVDVVRRKISENWLKYEVDPSISAARRVYLTFDILRDGSPANVQLEESSGVPSLDQSAIRAVERIDSFGPLPSGYGGGKVSVEFWFDYKR
jgi:protein TonB